MEKALKNLNYYTLVDSMRSLGLIMIGFGTFSLTTSLIGAILGASMETFQIYSAAVKGFNIVAMVVLATLTGLDKLQK